MSLRSPISLSRRSIFATSAAVSALTLTPLQPASAFVETAVAVAGLASSILSAGGKGSDISATAILAQMRMVEELHSRMDQVDESLALIMRQLGSVKKDIRDELEHDRDINRSESASGKTATTMGLLRDLASAEQNKDATQIARKRILIDTQMLALQDERNALQSRTDFVLPTLVSTMVTEVNALKAVHAPRNEISRVLEEYDRRLAMAQDVARKGSLADLRQELEAQQSVAAQAMSSVTEGKDSKELVSGTYPWVTHTKVHDERRARTVVCRELSPGQMRFEGPINVEPIPTQVEFLEPTQATYLTTCSQSYTVTVSEHSREMKRSITLTPIADGNAAGLFTLSIGYPAPIDVQPIAGAVAHGNSDSDFEKGKLDSDKGLQQTVTEFNDRANAILRLEQLQDVVSAARGLIVRWEDKKAGQAVAAADHLGRRSYEMLDLVEQDRRDAAISNRIAAQDAERRAAWTVVEDARRQVSLAIERAAKEKWRSDLVAGLSIFRASLQTYVAIDRDYFSSQNRQSTEAKGAKSVLKVADAATAIAGAAVAGPKGVRASSPSETTRGPTTRPLLSGDAAVNRIKSPMLENLGREKRVEAIIAEVGRSKIDYWHSLPSGPTHEELVLLEGMEQLDKMGETAADAFVREEQVTPGKFAGEVAKGAASEGAMGAAKNGLGEVLKPAIVADGTTLLGEQNRNALRRQLNELYQPYFMKRFSEDVRRGTDGSTIVKDVCMDKEGCVIPARP